MVIEPTDEQKLMEAARRHVQAKKGFYIHVVLYIVVNLGLFLINELTSPHVLWFYWPLLGWGVALIIHAIVLFGFGNWFGNDWEERQIKEYLRKKKKN
jgi:hypothetical protein